MTAVRALLVVNPVSTAAAAAGLPAITSPLAAVTRLDVAVTTHPGHAGELARGAGRDGFGVVLVLGGDGTVNEAVNGLLADAPDAGVESRPALGILPAGGMNVAARSLGLPPHPARAVRRLVAALSQERRTVVSLGRADGRYFLTGAGIGFGAELMARVDAARSAGGRPPTWRRYLTEGARQFRHATERRSPALRVEAEDGKAVDDVCAVLVANASPYAYLGPWPLSPCPRASWQGALEGFALTTLSVPRCTALMTRMLLAPRREHGGRAVRRFRQQRTLTVTADAPFALHMDGEPLDRCRRVRFTSLERALALAL
ncbi:diacylglycerol kinase family protein [Streptomyces sp. QH1-20]|uniref:diacylglycerol/lipid kinase family protein n=1 Tax=Streptomyces sp. QH1-20 TaxID=3240934 RepID=UPI0035125159